jgi:hypothetical protein
MRFHDMLRPIWLAVLIALCANAVQAEIYDLAGDWSDVNNPNGPWSLYKAPSVLFNTVQSDWYGNGTNQPAWADSTNANPIPPNPHVPMWAKAIGDVGTLTGDSIYNGFVNTGTVFMHSAEEFRTGTDFSSVVWTTPSDGYVNIFGGVWMSKAFMDRPHYWELRKNGTPFTGGPLTFGDSHNKNSPFFFANGTGGTSATNLLPVNQNDAIELLIYRTGGGLVPGTFVATTLNIEHIPEPSTTVILAGLSFAGLALRRRTKSRR